jgi:hypothetical protein
MFSEPRPPERPQALQGEAALLRSEPPQPEARRRLPALRFMQVSAFRTALAALITPGVLAIAISALGLFLRVEHALTFDGPVRGSDYGVYMQGVRWMLEHKRAFAFAPGLSGQVNYQPPLWYAAGAIVLHFTHSERAIAALAVLAWVVRQALLALLLRRAAPEAPWSGLAALWIHAVLPLGVLIDGKVTPEGMHAGLFMVALYFLWRMEREAGDAGIRTRTAVLFGLTAGLGLLTKATSSILMMTAVAVFTWRAALLLQAAGRPGISAVWRRIVRPLAVAGVIFCVVVGWWCGPNLSKYHHPFPHPWDREGPKEHAELAQPTSYRRPVGWALPFHIREYLRFPIIGGKNTPHPNFWGYSVIGTWTDLYNRGFCRLPDKATVDEVWGGRYGTMPQRPPWTVTQRCVSHLSKMAWLGLLLSCGTVLSVLAVARASLRSGGREGSLVLPLASALVVFFVFMFALVYPFDSMAVLNPRYLLAAATPMAACLGLALARLRPGSAWRRLAHAFSFAGIGAMTVLLLWERFGK